MTVAVVFPWRSDGSPHRAMNFNKVKEAYRLLLQDAIQVEADTSDKDFSRAGARNQGVRLAEEYGCDTVVVADADTIPEKEPLLSAIRGCRDGVLHLPYRRYRALTEAGTASYFKGADPYGCPVTDDIVDYSTGGVLVMKTESWWRVGGQDEGFQKHGHEDTAFRCVVDALLGPTKKHEGTITHLYHPPAWHLGSPSNIHNSERMKAYEEAEGNTEQMKKVLKNYGILVRE